MAVRRPLVLMDDNLMAELPAGDMLPPSDTKLYPKTIVVTASGSVSLPSTAMPYVKVLAVGGGGGGGNNNRSAGNPTSLSSGATTLLTAEGATTTTCGLGGGFGGYQLYSGGTSLYAYHVTPQSGIMGYGRGGGVGANATGAGPANTGFGGGAGAGTTINGLGGHGGGVVIKELALVPGNSYTVLIGSGGAAVTGGQPGGSGRLELTYWDTVP